MDSAGNHFKSILEYAGDYGKSTGLVSTSAITHATPASFIAHQPDRELYEDIALDFLKNNIDVFIGGGRKYFNNRKNGKNLCDSLRKKGYTVSFSIDEISHINEGKLAGLTAPEHNLKYSEGRKDWLPIATQTAISILNHNKKGFFLMVEGSMIDFACHDHDAQFMINEVLDFDRAVGKALDFAAKDGNTLVIVTADHETGGISLQDGNIKTGEVDIHFSLPGKYKQKHTAVMVPVFAYGPGADKFTGMFENTAIFDKMMNLFGFVK
jgi:alkaline phosphatase